MDSEADDYALLTQLIGDDRRFVVRMARDRAITEAEGKVRGGWSVSGDGRHTKCRAFTP